MSMSWRATLAEGGSEVLALEADLEQWESTEQAFAAGVAHFGRLDVVINNIGGDDLGAPVCRISAGSD
ncbi:1,6-dihydroxycyclohexa-2,4-diene-1-carboxylate dehydrogenase [Raoultella planticola]|uniref:1,6-dihydroxycyclohexa-2,4-diene-1-carboxylate dehydrogenase n=1 Tax=Raoultella planticola TaxID=575 RepID=A0A485A8D3_RAOPL|nr:1,6-dihydroxycyclohexa-2,4-diene-1-carboxylate dehydrogenase [Raoultella planticola]